MSDLRATNFRGRTSGSVPDFPDGVTVVSGISTLDSQGVRVAGIVTATSFSGDVPSIVTGNTSVQTVDTGSDGHVKVNTEGSERFRVASTGNVGIGTINPEDLLHLYGGASGASANSAAQLVLESSGSSNWIHFKNPNTQNAGLVWSDAAATERGVIMYNHNTDNMEIKGVDDLIFKTADTERMSITSNGGLLLSNGILVERCKIVATAWSTTNDISLDDGNVFLNTANLAGTNNYLDITSSNGLNVDLAVGDMTSVTCITAVNDAAAYIDAITVGGANVTESWVGGSAPTDGGSSGYDVYTFNIIKTAASTYVVIANQVKGS